MPSPNRRAPKSGLPWAEPSFDPDAFESRLVWIFGSPRSGSTWLLRLLCHPCVLEPSDGLGFSLPGERPAGSPLTALPVNEFLLGHHLMPQSGDPIKAQSGRYVPASLNFFWGGAPDYVLSRDYEQVWRPELRRFALIRLHATFARARARFAVAGDAVLVVKDVGTSHAARMTMSLLRRSRFLFLSRDGRDVIDSLLHAARPDGWFARRTGAVISDQGDRLGFIRSKAREWACWTDACTAAWEEHPAELRRKVRYEDLVADTAAELSGLCEWLGLTHDADAQEAAVRANEFGRNEPTGPLEFARAATPGLWREHFTPEEQRAAEEIMGTQLNRLGYPILHRRGP